MVIDTTFSFPGQWFSIAPVEKLCTDPMHSVSNDQIHEIVVFLHQSDGMSKHMDTFNNVMSLLRASLVWIPWDPAPTDTTTVDEICFSLSSLPLSLTHKELK
jgi:hypothetical protein